MGDLLSVYAVKRAKSGNVEIYRDKEMTSLFCVFECGRKSMPRRNQKTITLNCFKWRIRWIDEKYLTIARREYHRTKGLSAFNFEAPQTKRRINQHVIEHTFKDGSKLRVSSCACKVNHNYMTLIQPNGESVAQRMLFY